MFWSHDLLGKKTALGAVWIAAHGKKLNRGRIMQVNVAEACNKVMDPEVPQALRLQAILVGGIVIVHAKQQVYLLEDAQEMLRRLHALDSGEGGAEGAGAGAGKAVLGEGKRAAREEAITLPLTGDMQLLDLGDLFPTFHTQALSEGGSGAPSGQQQLGEGLFIMPSLPDELEPSEGGPAASRKGKGRRGASKQAAASDQAGRGGSEADRAGGSGRTGSGGGLLLGREEGDVELNLEGLPRHDLELMDGPETFAVPDIDMPGLEFFNLGGARPASSAGAPPAEHGGLPDDLVAVPSALLGEGDQLPGGQPEVEQQQPRSQTPQTSAERSDGPKGGAAPPRGRRARGGRGAGRRIKATIDDIDTLQIRGRDYREWMADRTDLLVARPLRAAAPPAGHGAAGKSALVVGPATASLMPGGAWPPELLELFMRNATLPAGKGAEEKTGGKKGKRKAGAIAGDEEREGSRAPSSRGRAPGFGVDAEGDTLLAPGAGEEGGFFGGLGGYGGLGEYGFGELPAEAPVGGFGYEEEAGFGGGAYGAGAAHPQRSGRSEEGEEEEDVETERLRAALNSTQANEPFFPIGLTPGSAPGSMRDGATGRGRRGAKRASSLLLRRDSEGGLSEKSSERRPGGSERLSDLLEGPGGPADGGAGANLGAMLPAVGEDEPYLEEGEEEAGGSRKRRRTGEPSGTLGTGTEGNGLTQFELLEASGPTQEFGGEGEGLAGPPSGEHLNRQTLAFIGVMRGRFDAAESQLEAEGGSQAADEEGGAARLSLFGMSERLSRMDAAKLFYQVLVTRTHGFLEAEQEEPYGDILLSRGEYL